MKFSLKTLLFIVTLICCCFGYIRWFSVSAEWQHNHKNWVWGDSIRVSSLVPIYGRTTNGDVIGSYWTNGVWPDLRPYFLTHGKSKDYFTNFSLILQGHKLAPLNGKQTNMVFGEIYPGEEGYESAGYTFQGPLDQSPRENVLLPYRIGLRPQKLPTYLIVHTAVGDYYYDIDVQNKKVSRRFSSPKRSKHENVYDGWIYFDPSKLIKEFRAG